MLSGKFISVMMIRQNRKLNTAIVFRSMDFQAEGEQWLQKRNKTGFIVFR